MAFEAFVLIGRPGGVLKADGEVELAGAHAGGQIGRGALGNGDERVRILLADALERGRDEAGERAGDRTDAQPGVALAQDLRELGLGEGEALGDCVCVDEQRLPRGGETRTARPALEQLAAELAFELRDLVRHRGLSERQRLGGAREGALVSDLAERQHPTRVHRPNLSLSEKS